MRQRDGIVLDLGAVFRLIWKNFWLLFLSGLAGGLFMLLASKFYMTPLFQASTKIYILNHEEGKKLTHNDIFVSSLLSQDYSDLITSREVLERSAKILGMDSSYEDLLKRVGVLSSNQNERILTILVRDPDPYTAYDLVNTVLHVAKEHIGQVVEDDIVTVVEDAVIPEVKTLPRAKRSSVLGAILTAGLCFLFLTIKTVRDDSIRTQEDVEEYLGLHVLGMVPREITPKPGERKKRNDFGTRGDI